MLTDKSFAEAREILRNKVARELSWELKRMPTPEEISMEMCKRIAKAYTPPPSIEETHPVYPGEDVNRSALIDAGYNTKDEE